MHKFNVGDRVKILVGKLVGMGYQAGGYIQDLDEYVGNIYTIIERSEGVREEWYRVRVEDGGEWAYDVHCLRRVRKAKPAEQPIPAPKPVVEAPRAIRTDFLPGDELKCVEPGDTTLVLNKVYTLSRATAGGFAYVVERPGVGYYQTRFVHNRVYYEDAVAPVKVKPRAIIKPSLEQLLREQTGENAGICSYAGQREDGTQWFQIRDGCHARIPRYYDQGSKSPMSKLVLDVQGHVKNIPEGKLPTYLKYVEYIINYSPWAPCFQKKGIDHVLKYGVNLNVDLPMHQMLGAAVALREGSEFTRKLVVFGKLLDKGYSGNTAYLLSACVEDIRGVLTFTGISNGHKVLAPQQDAEKLYKFFREGYVVNRDDKPYRTHFKDTTPIASRIAEYAVAGQKWINNVVKEMLPFKKAKDAWDVNYSTTEEGLFAAADKIELLVNKEFK